MMKTVRIVITAAVAIIAIWFVFARGIVPGKEALKPTSQLVLLSRVPFTPQAPLGNWSDPLQQNGCEETAAIMAIAWAQGRSLGAPESVEKQIIEFGKWQIERYGHGADTSARDTAQLIRDYFSYSRVESRKNIDTNDIIEELERGNLVIVPVNGQRLANPHYTAPGPVTHMLVIIGYDPAKQEFITNDPGTKRGKGYHYATTRLAEALQDYPTGPAHGRQIRGSTAMVVVSE